MRAVWSGFDRSEGVWARMTELQPAPDAGRARHGSRQRASQALAFDQLVQRYGTAFSDRPEQVHAGMWLVEQLGPGALVVDVGCGTGIPTARQLVDAGIQVVGIDTSPAMVSAAAAAVPEAVIHNRDVLDFTETGFDGAVAFFSLLMLPRSGIQRALSVLRKVIKPGGCLVIGMVEADKVTGDTLMCRLVDSSKSSPRRPISSRVFRHWSGRAGPDR